MLCFLPTEGQSINQSGHNKQAQFYKPIMCMSNACFNMANHCCNLYSPPLVYITGHMAFSHSTTWIYLLLLSQADQLEHQYILVALQMLNLLL